MSPSFAFQNCWFLSALSKVQGYLLMFHALGIPCPYCTSVQTLKSAYDKLQRSQRILGCSLPAVVDGKRWETWVAVEICCPGGASDRGCINQFLGVKVGSWKAANLGMHPELLRQHGHRPLCLHGRSEVRLKITALLQSPDAWKVS